MEKLAALIRHGARGRAIARRLYGQGVRTLADLRRAGALEQLPREAQINIKYNPLRQIPRKMGLHIAKALRRGLQHTERRTAPDLLPVGGMRRRTAFMRDFDCIVISRDPDVLKKIRVPLAVARYAAGAHRLAMILRVRAAGVTRYVRSDFYHVLPADLPYALYHYTGSARYNIRVRAHAKRRGWKLNQYGLFEAGTDRRVAGTAALKTERALARFLGITYRAPWDRDEH